MAIVMLLVWEAKPPTLEHNMTDTATLAAAITNASSLEALRDAMNTMGAATRWRVVQYKKYSGRGGFPSCDLRWAIERDGEEVLNQSGNVRSWGERASAVRAMKKLQE